MNDIVEQLRSEKKRVDSFLGSTTATKLCIEAALEIERLRADLETARREADLLLAELLFIGSEHNRTQKP